MIVDMMKYSFLVLKSEHEKFLERLSELGLIDIVIKDYTLSKLEEDLIDRAKELQVLYHKINIAQSEYKPLFENVTAFEGSVQEYEKRYAELTEQLEKRRANKVILQENLAQATAWGDFSIESVKRLEQHGLTLRYFSTMEKVFKTIQSEYPVAQISKVGENIYFVLVVAPNEDIVTDINNCREFTAPTVPFTQISTTLDSENKAIKELSNSIASLVKADSVIKEEIEEVTGQLNYNRAINGNEEVAEGSIVLINGWAPKDKTAELTPRFEAMPTTIFFVESPKITDEPPVLLRNNKFARSAEVVTRLYSLPNYNEVDMTPFFAPFFMLFVGMCLGDCGYGLLLLIGGFIAKIKMRKPDMQGAINLIIFCGISTIIIGFITGIFFGVKLPELEIFAPIKNWFIPSDNMFSIALAVGVIQILYAMILRSIIKMRRYGILYGFAGLGWAMIIISTIFAKFLPEAGITSFTTDSLAYYIVMGVSAIMMFFFQDPKKNIFMNFGMGLWDLYNNVTGLLGDVLSYVRLFALGLAGGVIAGVFNELAMVMSGDTPGFSIVIMVLIMLVGHSINFFMSAIGAVVHPLRLTFVEFYKNSGFEGGGKEYNPFKKKK